MAPAPVLLAAVAALGPQAPAMPEPRAETSAAAEAGRDYRIGPEDVLAITVYGHPDLTQTVTVQADGGFVYPLLGRVPADEMSPPELEQRMADLLAAGFIREPRVAVTVQQYRSKVVFVMGAVARPGLYPLVGTRRLVEVLARAGPMTEGAGTEAVVVRPRSRGTRPVLPSEVEGPATAGAEVVRVDLRALQAGDLERNVALLPGDTVFVPAAPRVFVSGKVRNPGGYPFAPGITVRQAVGLAGGSVSSASRVRVVREVGGRAREVRLGLDDPVQPGDTLIVRGGLF